MPQLDLSVYFVEGLNFSNFFVIMYGVFFILSPVIIGLLKSRKKIKKCY